ncbi:MmgE/PrpD family protein [Rhodococcus rhodochrous]|uniref:MmgE/PrpD family protein n=1 Tax=Rhodococcus rhodochrous TaxID=1829 RepID=A0AA47A8W1_RHORH|nr:MmgE/PrpD family protein [Rhodococcus rhodochrous]MCB8908548.1 MmgE/PrpD family protein [Rhodococcus rhodochrous]MDO1486693.1 MmgE/PrpD family protein [Rhodococcus rhodochrous]TWH51509.1 2-methylcitrate dehydratase PrpD [Rhodococcus rhodochrous J38]UZF42937.1 MmgE/PrpD family protein [Rhodococcus rhodochrous]SNV19844.1 MmgE/PrpD family protein [Rhodococcus rhodochrous]
MTSTETRHDLTGTVVGRLAALAAEIRTTGLPAELRKDVARRVLDLLGNSLAAHDQPSARAVTEVARNWSGAAAATGIGTGERFPAATAALVNGTLAHSMDSDDTHLPSVLHPSASVIPAALAVGEAVGASGAAVLDAAGVGIEIVVRLGMGGYDEELGNSEFFERGQHATSICGAVGSAAAAAVLYGLEAEGIADAMGIAASFGAGLLEANRTGGTVKRTHCGWAAHSGVTSAEFARAGLTGPPTVIEGRFGFLHAFCGDRADTAKVLDGLGEHWELPGIFFKPYPCNHFTHAGIDAARALVRDGLDPADIVEIQLGVPKPVLRTIAEPPASKAAPESGYHAAFSGPFTVARALLGGSGLGVGHADFTDAAAKDPRTLELARLVTSYSDDRCDEIYPHQFPAVLRVRTRDGSWHEARVDHNRGGPANPLSDDELTMKFDLNVEGRLSPESAAEVAGTALALPAAESLDALMATVRG